MKLTIISANNVDIKKYKKIYNINIQIDGKPSNLMVGIEESEIGFEIISGHDIMRFFETEKNFYHLIVDVINKFEKNN